MTTPAPSCTRPTERRPIGVEELQSRHVGVRLVPAGAGGVGISPVLRDLYTVGVRSLLVEGGAR